MSATDEGYVLTTLIALFAIMGVLSLPPVFLSVTATMSAAERRKTALQTALTVGIVMVVSYFIGDTILDIFKIDPEAFRVAGALVVASMAWSMISGKPSALLDSRGSSPAVIPLAIPKTAGPGAIALAISMGTGESGMSILDDLVAIVGVTAIALAFMLAAGPIERLLHASGLNILNRLFGLILLAIALTSILSSLRTFFPGWAG
ncbi:MAG: NAAT family transporter [Actinobacteria bacterium]|nr:NAAT family transporter [Actinomycetota bacterium]